MKTSKHTSLYSLTALTLGALIHTSPAFAETTFGGAIEVEATYEDNGTTTTDNLDLSTAELSVDHKMSDKVDGHLLFLYEKGENNDKIAVDEATINFHPNDSTDISLGRQYAPFGSYESNMVSDPLPLELGETQIGGASISKAFNDNVSVSAYVYKGSGSSVDDGGLSLDYSRDNFNAGIGYISDAADTDDATDRGAVGVYANGTVGRTTLIAEHVRLDSENGVRPNATQLEIGFDLGNDKTLAFTTQQTRNAQGMDLPKKAHGVVYSMPIYTNTTLGAEYMRAEQYDGTDVDSVTLLVAYEF